MTRLASDSGNYLEIVRTISSLKPETIRFEEDIQYTVWRYDNAERTYRKDTDGDDTDVWAAGVDQPFVWYGEAVSDIVRPIRRQVEYDIASGFCTRRDTFLQPDLHPTRRETGKVSNKYSPTQTELSESNATSIATAGPS
jgi:hypothetical protein